MNQGSNLFPDLEDNGKKVKGGGVLTQCNNSSVSMERQAEVQSSTKQILLRHQCMPLYPTTEDSREQLICFMDRYHTSIGKTWLSDYDGSGLNCNLIREHVIILHSLFSNFCAPPPSIESICSVVLLESKRVASLRGRGVEESLFLDAKFEGGLDLPRDPLIHTTASSAAFVIALLKSPPKECMLKLPLEFQLSFFRILVRLLSEEGDQDYDEECLFDWTFMQKGNASNESSTNGNGLDGNNYGTKKDLIADNELDSSYHIVQPGASFSSGTKNNTPASKQAHQKSAQFHRSNSAVDIVTQAWNYGSWKKKKSSPLYSILRFCSNLAWRSNAEDPINSSNTLHRQRWDFVADNVKLDDEEEKELNSENVFESSRERSGSGSSEKLVEALMKVYQSIRDCCSKAGQETNAPGQYLLFGPVAHFLGLTISASASSVKHLHQLLVMAEGSDSTKTITKQNQRRASLSNSFNKQSLQETLPFLARLHIIRLLRYAAEYSSQSIGIMDKVGPLSFFSFGDSAKGLCTTLTNKPWPFKYDFCMACWFRAETFVRASYRSGSGENNRRTILFLTETEDGAQIELSFESCSDGGDNLFATAATLLVTITDAHEPNVNKIPRKIRLVGCVLSPSVWYHVAVRLTKSKSSPFALNFNKTNELSIFLNGKIMLRTTMKLPRFPENYNSLGGALGFASFGKQASNVTKALPRIELTFFSNFDGEAGTLYVFNELISDETIELLHRETAGQSEHGSWFTFSDGWDASRSKLGHIAKALSSASMLSELEDLVLPDYPILIGTVARKRKVLIDVQGDTSPGPSLASKPFLVWDPTRMMNEKVVDLHSGTDSMLDEDISTWSFESIKDVLQSLGGPKRLIPLFAILSELPVIEISENNVFEKTGINPDWAHTFISSIVFLVASFAREHPLNARELYRCGAAHVIHKILHDRKRQELESYGGAYYGMGASLAVAKRNVSALLDLWHSSRQVFGLEVIVFSQLLFNVTLLFGGVSTCNGAHLHTVLLPVLSEITRQNPDKVRDGVGTKPFIDCIREYSTVECDQEESIEILSEPKAAPFDRPSHSSSTPAHLTVLERRLFVDFMLGMVAAMLSKSSPVNDLSPLVTFLTSSLESMWQNDNQTSKIPKSVYSEHQRRKKYLRDKNECWYLATAKTANVLFFLLQSSPPIPHLIESLTSLLESGGGVASWLLCSMVNQFDDTIRGTGIKCLAAYLNATLDFTTVGPRDLSLNQQNGSTVKLSNAVKYGLGVISHSSNVLASLLAGRGNVKVIFQLLWHLLKCHSDRLGVGSDSGLMYLLVDDCDPKSSLSLEDLVVTNNFFPGGGVLLDTEKLNDSQSRQSPLSRQNIRNVYGVGAVMRLLRFMTNEQKERWLFDILALVLASPNSVTVVLSCDDWQPCLFSLVAEVVDEISSTPVDECSSEYSHGTVRKFDTSALSRPSVRTRYDLSLKLYSTLLGHCMRKGDEKAYEAIETTASLQRVDVNGPEVFGIILSHLFADLIEKGTVEHVEETYNKEAQVKNRALKQSARLVTQAILTNGQGELDMPAAVKQWRSLRHLTALAVAVVTDFGFGITELFDYQLQDAAATDAITGGTYGIRLGDNLVSGLNAFEALASSQLYSTKDRDNERSLQKRHRFVSVVLASQVLTLLDAFIFPDNLDSSTSATQLHGLALVRGSEPRLGQSQGPLLASLVRLSLVLLNFLEPCSVRFLQACSRLRCFLHWALEIIRESVALGGYSTPYHDLTAPYDRVVLAVVLHCHRALSRCSTLLVELESSPWDKYFGDVESWQKNHRRLFRAIMELREIVLAAIRGRNEVLRLSFSLEAHDALSRCLEAPESVNQQKPIEPAKSKEDQLRNFLSHDWVTGFHDVHVRNKTIIPDAVGGSMGKEALETLTSESMAIIKDYKHIMNAPWKAFCEHQRKWAETDAVREMEHTGDVLVKKLSNKDRSDASESNKLLMIGFSLASQRFSSLLQLAHNPWVKRANWEFSSYTDLLFRRIVLSRIVDFDDHRLASYELTLGKDREQLQEEEKLKREQEIKNALLQAGEAIVPYHQDTDVEDDPEESFVGWDDHEENTEPIEFGIPADEGHPFEPAFAEDKSLTTDTREKSDLDWDQLDFDEAAADSDPYAWAKKFVWSEGETFIRTFESVLIVTLRTNTKGTLLMTTQNLYFHQTCEVVDVMTREKVEIPMQDRKWKLNRLTDVHGRRYMLKAQAIELFFCDMRGVFVAFDGPKERDLFVAKLSKCKAPLLRPLTSLNPRVIFKKSKITELWKKRKLSNFQYLMALNLMAGRTFNDITQYPVFPWILADYESEELDLSDRRIYRDLSKPVGALNPDRLACLIERFNELDGFPEEEKFLYGSHYSSPGVVLHYLVRQEPFTSMHIALQSGRFDCPDRLFFDIGGCWRSCLSSTSDVKELLPEFFTSPEIFINTNAFPLGETQNKVPVDNVILPPWAKGSAHEFVRIHRLALESEYVSNNLHHWVDLIFGYKQRGPAAAQAHNIFHPLSYEGAVDIDKITDEVQRSAIEGHIQNFGQTPCQLIVKDPHPARLHGEPVAGRLFSEGHGGYEHLHCHTPNRQFGDHRYNEARGAVVSLQLQGDSILSIHSDFTICSYKLYPCRGTIPFQFKQERAKKLECMSYNVVQSTLSNQAGDLSFALAKGGSDKSNDPGSSITDAYFLMSIGYYDYSVKIHLADSLHLQSTINGVHRGQINCIQVSTDGTVVVTGGEDCTCVVWVVDYEDFAISIADGVVQPGDEWSEDEILSCCHILLGHTSPITCLAISTKLDIVVSGSQDGTVCLHTIRSGKFVRSLHINAVSHQVENSCAGNGVPVVKLAIHSNGIFVAHLCDGSLHVITVNGHRLATINIGEKLNSMIICHQSETLITGGEQGLARMWNLHDLGAKCTVDVSKYGQITGLLLIPSDYSPISQFLSIGSENGLLSVVYREC